MATTINVFSTEKAHYRQQFRTGSVEVWLPTASGCEPNRSVSDRSIVTALHRKHAQGDIPLRPLAQVLRGQFDQFLSVKLMAVLAHFYCRRE